MSNPYQEAREAMLEHAPPRTFMSNYDVDGRNKVEARRKVDLCMPRWSPEGPNSELPFYTDEDGLDRVRPVNFEDEFVEAVGWMGKDASIMDIGCSFPFLLIRLQQEGFRGRLIGVEPNTAQFNGLSYWEPKDRSADYESILASGDEKRLAAYFELNKSKDQAWPGVELYQTDANFLPAVNDSIDIAAFMFSFYHVPHMKQLPAINEVRRVLKKTYRGNDQSKTSFEAYGMMALATSGERNKIGMRFSESQIAMHLSRTDGRSYQAPPPLSSGFTSEDAREVVPHAFRHIYEYNHSAEIVVDTEARVQIMLDAYRSLRDQYKTRDGSAPSEDLFEEILSRVVGSVLFRALDKGETDTVDFIDRSLFFASDRQLDLPQKFSELN